MLLHAANYFSWNAAKASHAMLLCQMEQGEIASYQDAEKTDRVGRANAQRHVTITQNNVQNLAQKNLLQKLPSPCFVRITTLVPEFISNLMIQNVLFLNISVHLVSLSQAKHFHIQNQKKQKKKKKFTTVA